MPPRPRRGNAPPTPRTARGARIVEVKERDPVAERDEALSAAYADYNELCDAAFIDYLAESKAAWDRYQARLKGITTDYHAEVGRIRKT